MGEDNIKTRVVGVDISNERTTYAIVDIRGNIIAEDQRDSQMDTSPDESQKQEKEQDDEI